MEFDVNEGWKLMEKKIAFIEQSKSLGKFYEGIVWAAVEPSNDGDTFNKNWKGFHLMNSVLNAAIKDRYFAGEDYHQLCNFCGMWGFRFSDHFKLL